LRLPVTPGGDAQGSLGTKKPRSNFERGFFVTSIEYSIWRFYGVESGLIAEDFTIKSSALALPIAKTV